MSWVVKARQVMRRCMPCLAAREPLLKELPAEQAVWARYQAWC